MAPASALTHGAHRAGKPFCSLHPVPAQAKGGGLWPSQGPGHSGCRKARLEGQGWHGSLAVAHQLAASSCGRSFLDDSGLPGASRPSLPYFQIGRAVHRRLSTPSPLLNLGTKLTHVFFPEASQETAFPFCHDFSKYGHDSGITHAFCSGFDM